MDIRGKRVLLTGASGGIGVPLATRLAQLEARIALVGRRREPLETLAARLPQSAVVEADLSTAQGCRAAVMGARVALGGIDVLVHLAGAGSFRAFADEDDETIERLLRTNCASAMWLAKALLPEMTARGSGRLVFCGSVLGALALPGYTAYAASKFALRGFTEGLRRELAGSGVGVTLVAPRAVRTALNPPEVYEMAQETGMAVDPPEIVADALLDALLDDAREVVLGGMEPWFVRLNALWPGLFDRLLRKQAETVRRFVRRKEIQAEIQELERKQATR